MAAHPTETVKKITGSKKPVAPHQPWEGFLSSVAENNHFRLKTFDPKLKIPHTTKSPSQDASINDRTTTQEPPHSKGVRSLSVPADLPRYVHQMPSLDKVALVKDGLLAESISDVAFAMDITLDNTNRFLGLPASTIARKIREKQPLATEQAEKVVQLVSLIGLVEQIVDEYGDPKSTLDFDAARWLGEWIEKPQPSLGMRKPSEFLDTATGIAMIETLLKRIAAGAFA
ncbi:putative toxin-antitoxin system antitoxin component (TIGR02293 family) [Comamonas sp. BIGb0124]|uniref:antitoxin Xre/MbcA/ParS toxin-binding domain-containing protein n=1 Tax=Comamonas sp. BIGb0124 TaxID=2485130 RepID=UPI000F47997C|nr:antitoxin Xre/MbcA/ParS toxin-binding domain-containing protein [Comamonas sp. BIGb0124]ROR21468.1 putative toxin-antitoxin system antitoxin component (TIGR02293 family) [Comamonas sp. BIGb0124]